MRSSILIVGLVLSCCLLFAVHAEESTNNNNWFQNLIARPTYSSQSEMCDNLAKALNGESDITELIDQEHFELSFPTNIFPAGNFFGVDGVRLFAQRINALMEINNKTVSVLGSDDVKQVCHIDIMVDFTVRATGLKSPEGARITLVAQAWKDKFVSARLNIPSNQIYNHVSGLFLLPEQHHLKALAQGIYHVGYDSPCLAKTFLTEDTTIIIDSLAGKLQFSGYTAIARIVDWLQYHLYGMTPGNNGKRSIDSFFRGLLEESSNDNTNDKVDDDSSIIDRRRDDALLKAIADSNEDECREYLSNNRGTDEMIASDMLALATTADRVRESIGFSDNNDENSCAASTFVSNFKSHHHGHRRHFHRTLPMLLPFVHMCDHVWTEAGQTTYDCFVPPLSEPLRHFIPHRALHWMYVHGLGVRVTTHWTDDGKLNLLEYVPMQQVSFVHGDWHSHAHPDPTPDPHPDPHRRSSRPSLLNSN